MAQDELLLLALGEVIEEIEMNDEKSRKFYEVVNPFTDLLEDKFRKKYRLPKPVLLNLIEGLLPYINPQTRKSSLSVEIKVLTAVRFFASGSYQQDIGENIHSSIRQPSASRCIEEVSCALNVLTIFNKYVAFPRTLAEFNTIQRGFQEFQRHERRVPGIIGAIDYTHVAIVPPNANGPDPEYIYVNRKGYHSINTQLVKKSNFF